MVANLGDALAQSEAKYTSKAAKLYRQQLTKLVQENLEHEHDALAEPADEVYSFSYHNFLIGVQPCNRLTFSLLLLCRLFRKLEMVWNA